MITQRPPGREQVGERGEEALELIELGVDRDAQPWNVRVAGWIFDLRCSTIGIARAHSGRELGGRVEPVLARAPP